MGAKNSVDRNSFLKMVLEAVEKNDLIANTDKIVQSCPTDVYSTSLRIAQMVVDQNNNRDIVLDSNRRVDKDTLFLSSTLLRHLIDNYTKTVSVIALEKQIDTLFPTTLINELTRKYLVPFNSEDFAVFRANFGNHLS